MLMCKDEGINLVVEDVQKFAERNRTVEMEADLKRREILMSIAIQINGREVTPHIVRLICARMEISDY